MRDNGESSKSSVRRRLKTNRGRTLGATLESKRFVREPSETVSTQWSLASAVALVGRVACLLVLTVFVWFRGAVDYWPQVWIGLLLVVALAAWMLEYLLDRKGTSKGLPWIILPVIAGLGLGFVQLIPLSNSVADIVAPVQKGWLESLASPAGIADSPPTPVTRISLDPTNGKQQLALLGFALSGLILGAHYFKSGVHAAWLFVVVAGNASAIAIVGMLQRIPFSGEPLLANEKVSGVFPFAFFVNRNNAAGYMLMGLAAAAGLLYWNLFRDSPNRKPRQIISREIPVWRQIQQQIGLFISELTPTRLACLALVTIPALGVIATLSRGGVFALLVGGLLTTMTFGLVRDSETRVGWAAFTMVGVIGLAIWLGFGTQLVTRFEELNDPTALSTTDRIRHWTDTLPAMLDFGFLGSGLGSYHAVHRLYRGDLEERMFEHADNQYVETLIETGWVGLALLLIAIGLVVWAVAYISRSGSSARTMAIGVAGLFLIASIGVASVADFGVQIPAITMTMAFLVGVIAQHAHSLASRSKKKSMLRRELPAFLTPLIVALVLLGVGWSTWYLRSLAAMERLGAVWPLREDYLTLPLEQVNRNISELETLVAATPTPWGYRRLGELHIHRYRLARFADLVDRLPASPASLWQSTNLVSLHEQMNQFRRTGDQRLIEAYAASPEARADIVPAWKALIASRNLLPFQSDVQLMLGQIQAVFGDQEKSQICLDRARRTAPTNADFAYIIGLMHMQADRIDLAAANWKSCVTLQPRYFEKVMDRIHSPDGNRWKLEPEFVSQAIVPNDPRLLASFCANHLQGDRYAALRKSCYERADQLMIKSSSISSDPKVVALEIQIKLGLGQKQEALDKMKWLVRLSPVNMRMVDIRFEMAQLMFELDLIDEAFEEIKWLRKNDVAHAKRYSGLYDKLRLRLEKQPEDM